MASVTRVMISLFKKLSSFFVFRFLLFEEALPADDFLVVVFLLEEFLFVFFDAVDFLVAVFHFADAGILGPPMLS